MPATSQPLFRGRGESYEGICLAWFGYSLGGRLLDGSQRMRRQSCRRDHRRRKGMGKRLQEQRGHPDSFGQAQGGNQQENCQSDDGANEGIRTASPERVSRQRSSRKRQRGARGQRLTSPQRISPQRTLAYA